MDVLTNELLELLNKKQEAAFEVVFSLYYPRLVYFAKEYVPHEDAEGLVQDAFIAFWEKHPSLTNKFQLQSYLYTSVKNNCLMHLRHQKVKKRYDEMAALEMQNLLHLSALKQLDTSIVSFQEIESIIERTMADLPPRCREIFTLSRFENKKNQEVAKALNISVKAVEAQISKALKVLKIALKDFLPLLTYLFLNN
ncbi:RNA polymerase sigma-70 factor, ECF subfamily [Saccharicrinis carchari]|uniref:RNA polymerase sigma-70 factor, ECF subfamily n=1 Tax=Saccharicrinis carchari TaxID=1168039 RepID=A0A521ABP1_SACCC|nr:RNA polymerase sigma-70 factor [Saccharicrinis carchari]SMO32206.1 RNA polymerase sigma-70 factor, ECF subfamily [Saccharicrinis carchari]